ncbi:MAG: BatA domain-containing protein [Phycisphaerae bacterium]
MAFIDNILVPAAINFSDPLMLVGFLAAGVPVMLHLLNRVRSPVVQFPTLRFLRITAQKTSRRRQLQHWLLLLLRMAVFALIAMAIAGPLVHGGSPLTAYGLIFLMLGGIALMALMAVSFAGALESRKAPRAVDTQGQSPAGSSTTAGPAKAKRTLGTALSALLLLVGALAALFALFGLSTDSILPSSGGSFNGDSTACVIILDNSQSMLMQQGTGTRLEQSLAVTRELLTRVINPAEFAVLLTNPGRQPVADHLTTNRIGVLGRLNTTNSLGQARPMQELVRRAVDLLKSADQPNHVLVIISDFAGPAATDLQAFAPLKKDPNLQLVLMPQAAATTPDDVGVRSLAISSGQAVVGSTIYFKAQAVNNGQTAVVPDFVLKVDGQAQPDSKVHVQLAPSGATGSQGTLRLAYKLAQAGDHVFTLQLVVPSNAMPWADSRSLALHVASQVKVLVLGPSALMASDSTAFYVDAALAPFGPQTAANKGQPIWSVQPTYASAANLSQFNLSRYGAIFLCDVPSISPAMADELHSFVTAGGRICWLLGPAVNASEYNQVLANTRQLLPGDLQGPVSQPAGNNVSWIDLKSHVFANLYDNQDPFRRIVVVGRWALADNSPAFGRTLSKLDDDGLFLTRQKQGQGRIYTFFSTPGGGWTNFASTSAFLPMMVRIALGSAAGSSLHTSYQPQQIVAIPVAAGTPADLSVNVRAPRSSLPINVKTSLTAEGRPQWLYTHTLLTGIYHWRTFDHKQSGIFVVNPPSEEVAIRPVAAKVIAGEAPKGQHVYIAATAEELLQELQKAAHGSSLEPGVLALVLILAILEALFANRYRPMLRPAGSGEEVDRTALRPAEQALSSTV